jgi:hypothetical protein
LTSGIVGKTPKAITADPREVHKGSPITPLGEHKAPKSEPNHAKS